MSCPEKDRIKIRAFCCQQSAVEAYKMAKTMKLNVPENLDIVEVKCTGSIDVIDMIRAFEEGVDGVIVVACHEGNCQFLSGNTRAKMRVEKTRKLLEELEIESSRLEIFNVASNMGAGFSKITSEMNERISKLGKSRLS